MVSTWDISLEDWSVSGERNRNVREKKFHQSLHSLKMLHPRVQREELLKQKFQEVGKSFLKASCSKLPHLSVSKQHVFIIIYYIIYLSYYLKVRIPEIKASALHPFWECLGRMCLCPFQLLEITCIPWSGPPPSNVITWPLPHNIYASASLLIPPGSSSNTPVSPSYKNCYH